MQISKLTLMCGRELRHNHHRLLRKKCPTNVNNGGIKMQESNRP